MDLIPEFRVEFDQLVDSMHHQLDVHADALFQLFVAKLNKSSSNDIVLESRKPQLEPGSISLTIPGVTFSQPNHSAESQPLNGHPYDVEHLSSQPSIELGPFSSVQTDVTTDNLQQDSGMK